MKRWRDGIIIMWFQDRLEKNLLKQAWLELASMSLKFSKLTNPLYWHIWMGLRVGGTRAVILTQNQGPPIGPPLNYQELCVFVFLQSIDRQQSRPLTIFCWRGLWTRPSAKLGSVWMWRWYNSILRSFLSGATWIRSPIVVLKSKSVWISWFLWIKDTKAM